MHDAFHGLARGLAIGGELDPVVDGVADEVHERVLDRLDDRTVQLRVVALGLDTHLLAQRQAEIADHAGEAGPGGVDRLQTGAHHAVLQIGGDRVEVLGGRGQDGVVLGAGREFADVVAGEDELADKRHQVVEDADVDADVGVGDRGAGGLGDGLGGVLGLGGLWGSGTGGRVGGLVLLARGRWRDGDALVGGGAARGAEPLERGHEVQEVLVAVVAGSLDVVQHLAQGISGGEQGARDRGIDLEGAVAEAAEQRFRRVCDALQPGEAEEPAGAFDRVHHAEDAREGVLGMGIAFEGEQVAIQAVERLVALNQELLDDLVHVVVHAVLPVGAAWCGCIPRTHKAFVRWGGGL